MSERPLSAVEYGYMHRLVNDGESSLMHWLDTVADKFDRGTATAAGMAKDRETYTVRRALILAIRDRMNAPTERWPETLDEALSTLLRDHLGG